MLRFGCMYPASWSRICIFIWHSPEHSFMINIIIFISFFAISISASGLNTIPCMYATQPTETEQRSNVFSWFVVCWKLFWACSYLDVFLIDKIEDTAVCTQDENWDRSWKQVARMNFKYSQKKREVQKLLSKICFPVIGLNLWRIKINLKKWTWGIGRNMC